MAEIGETIREIRKGKGILQKVLYKGIVSPTFASQFEKGTHRMNSEAFLEILDRLSMNSDEFQKIHRGFQENKYTVLSNALIDAMNQKDILQIEELLLDFEEYQTVFQYSLVRALAKMNIARLKGETLDEESANVKVIVRFLAKIDNWTLSDIVFITNFSPFVPYELLIVQVKPIEEKLKKHNELRLLCYFYNNLLDRAFLEKDYQNAKILCTNLAEIAQAPEFLFFKMMSQVFSDLLELAQKETNATQRQAYLERIDIIVRILEQYTSFELEEEIGQHIRNLEEKN
ncbi:hypothetical protein BAU15_00435 [Enterococcus sp. JM4C]|uniref:helix-turn-helix domain-containing protein n=1 Tax=Candidatus Enterococcus huntleyi TaxID=1857217 RepID=UPI00137A0D3C|nr:Rgg/GadR/MutR family transcriptional regulator [Enterococcus sp. JM4C]KAF1299147.1 hypothetical protein BAU15_00435 [Enterococcus sp. JM4C]